MRQRLTVLCAVLICSALLALPARAEEGNVFTGVKVGTLGLQAEVGYSFNKYFAARLSGTGLVANYDTTVDKLDYDFDVNLYTLGMLLDWHPAAGGFRLTAGVIVTNPDLSASAKVKDGEMYDIGDNSYPGVLLGKVDAEADFNKVAPFVGLGYNNSFSDDSHWSFNMDLGVVFWGSPDVSLTTPTSKLVPGLQDDLDKEAEKVESELDNLTFYPLLQIGISYAF